MIRIGKTARARGGIVFVEEISLHRRLAVAVPTVQAAAPTIQPVDRSISLPADVEAIEQARLLTLKTAWLIDTHGVKAARSEISQIKVIAPAIAQKAADAAMQIHGGAGVSDDFPLAALYAYARVLRLVDGPDEVHRGVVAKLELAAQRVASGAAPT